MNQSPWIAQLNQDRPTRELKNDLAADIVVVGGGIAGITTAYYTLTRTNRSVVLVEGHKIAYGATGHNAGQLVTYFERPFSKIIKQFGLKLAAEGQTAVESAWTLLDDMIKDAHLTAPCYQFTGQAGIQDLTELLTHLKNNSFRQKAGLTVPMITVAEEWSEATRIPKKFNALIAFAPHSTVMEMLETKDLRFIAALPERKGVMNSAMLCEELAGYMLNKFASRFALYEHTPVQSVILNSDEARMKCGPAKITANNVVLCTNGFEKIKIINNTGPDIDARFHHMVKGSVGYMAGYLDQSGQSPISISYLPTARSGNDSFSSEPYFYLTRRPYKLDGQMHNLICAGGPEALLDDTNNYQQEHPYPQEAQDQIDQFLHKTYAHAPTDKINYRFQWHGLMGYTPNGIRLIGPEPRNCKLLYNLGCNGTGLMPSIYGGYKISQYLANEDLPASIFDPK
jgi:glycine/D-amino acid oxidase-like deaminating enzyme